MGELLARQFEKMDRRIRVIHASSNSVPAKGLLARDILSHRRFRYLILERSPAMRSRQQELLQDYDITWIEELPAGLTGCIFSNEFFDALPVHRVVCRGGMLKEIYVGEDFEEIEGELQPPVAALSRALELGFGKARQPSINLEARHGSGGLPHRSAGDTTWRSTTDISAMNSIAQPRGTLMCYWRHQALENPYIHIGEQDMTAHVNFSDLMEEPSLRDSYVRNAEGLPDSASASSMKCRNSRPPAMRTPCSD